MKKSVVIRRKDTPNIRLQWIGPCVCRDIDAWTFLLFILIMEVQSDEHGS